MEASTIQWKEKNGKVIDVNSPKQVKVVWVMLIILTKWKVHMKLIEIVRISGTVWNPLSGNPVSRMRQKPECKMIIKK